MTRHFDVIVIGAGLFGAFTALHLARMGQRVALVERGAVGAQSSGANFGGLRLQGRSVEQYPLSLLAQQVWETFETVIGEDCDYDRNGMIYFARTEAGRKKLLAYADNSRACGLDIALWQGADLRRAMPWLAAQDGMIASYSPRCAVANPRLATPAVVRALVRAGGVLFEHCAATAIKRSESGFCVSGPALGALAAGRLVNAAGGWAGAISAQFDEAVPLFSAGPPQFVTEPLPYALRPSVYAIEGDLILRQIPRGNVIFAGYPRTMANADGQHTFVPPAKTLAGMRAIAQHVPALRNAEVIRVWSGVEGYLPDMLPVIGASRTTPGLFHAFGGSGGGFQIAPAVGECLAHLVCGTPGPVDLAPYAIDRFSGPVRVSDKLAAEFDQGKSAG
ncbi:sarcosine oxidase subunit beta [Gemmobacter megaterium]|uniref:Sarcosine oxidase subunit beta n=1 Tax=Gemmobacter megaterium TaxID=1086013 RepID=A0A1N7KGI0_9RHOB|nr:FAD-binding oxidoreductase [Gemmobacter megaterium]GGE02022.1 FAD-binding oxidoreductase [Gemmobacter megaterium]SIS60683.1 sarcosine oxidase subunit beta [Gemmobacter megaterium]